MGEFKLSFRHVTADAQIVPPKQTLDVVIEPMDPAVQQAVQKIKQIDPYVFKNVTKIIVHSGGGGGQLGHVEKGPGKDPHEIHIFKDRIKTLVTKQYRNVSDPKAIQDAITLALIEVIGHESGHIGKLRTEQQIVQTPFLGEGEAEARGKELAQKARPTMRTAMLKAAIVLDELRLKLLPGVPMTEPNLSFIARVANNDSKQIVKEGLELLKSDSIHPAIFEIDDAVDFNKKAIRDPKVIKVIGIIQDKVGVKDYSSQDFVTSLAKMQSWMGIEPTGKLDKPTVSKFNQPSKNLPRNFGVVTPGLIFRGGIIENENQLNVMKDMFGIERVISLHEDDDIPRMCLNAGVEYMPMPFNDGESDEEGRMLFNDSVAKVLDEKPVYVHCLYGQDRTGGVIARYRTEKGWPCQLAYAEAKAYGFQDKFPDMIDWFCEPASDKPPVDTKKIRNVLNKKEQNSIDSMQFMKLPEPKVDTKLPLNPVPNDIPFSNPFNPSEAHNYLIWSDTINNITPSMSLNGMTAISCRVNKKVAYINEVDKDKEVLDDIKEEGEDGKEAVDMLTETSGVRGDIKPEDPWGGFNVEPYFAAKGEPTY